MSGPREPREPDERLSDWVDGRMSDRERERFEAEMRVNARLLQEAEAFQRTVTTLQQALRQDPGRANIADRVMAALQQQAAPPVRPIRSVRGMSWLFGLSAAAALLLTLFLLQQWQPAVPPPGEQPVADAPIAAPEAGRFRAAADPKAEAKELSDLEADRDASLHAAWVDKYGERKPGDGGLADDLRQDEVQRKDQVRKQEEGKGAADSSTGVAAPQTAAPKPAAPQEAAPNPAAPATPPKPQGQVAGLEQLEKQKEGQSPPATGPRRGIDRNAPADTGSGAPAATQGKADGAARDPAPAAPGASLVVTGGSAAPVKNGVDSASPDRSRLSADDKAAEKPASSSQEAKPPAGNWNRQAAGQPMLQMIVMTRQLPSDPEALRRANDKDEGEKKAPRSAAVPEAKAAAPATGGDDFFLGAAGYAPAVPQNLAWLGRFVAAPTGQVLALAAAAAPFAYKDAVAGLSVQTFDVLALANERGLERRAAAGQSKARDEELAPGWRDMLEQLAPSPANVTRLAVIEGGRDDVKGLIADARRYATQNHLDFALQELPEAALIELQQQVEAPQRPQEQAKASAPGARGQDGERRSEREALDARPEAPSPAPGELPRGRDVALQERLRIGILFRELPPPPPPAQKR